MDINESQSLVYSNISKRFGAYLIDFFVLFGILSVELLVIRGIRYLDVIHITGKQWSIVVNVLGFIDNIIYFSLLESSKKQATIGKRSMGILVTNLHGERISVGRAFLRTIIKFIGSVIFIITSIKQMPTLNFLGYILVFFLPKKQALNDLLAGTVVICGKI